jgi:membrane protein DedA with SNARE-associated domain
VDLALDFLARHLSDYTYLGLFLILSVGAFGFPIPEEVVLVAAGLFVYQGVSHLGPTLLVCAAGQLIGDLLLFGVGRRYGTGIADRLARRFVPPARVERVHRWLDRWGLLVVFFGRYLTGVRPAVFLAAGASRLELRRFLVVDGMSALVSLAVWVSIGLAFSDWIEIALNALGRTEEQILAGLGAVLLVLLLEKVVVRFGMMRDGSPAVRVTNWVRIPIVAVTVVFALALGREHHLAKRLQLLDASARATPTAVTDMGLLLEVLPDLAGEHGPVEMVFVGEGDVLDQALAQAGYRSLAGTGAEPERHFRGGEAGQRGMDLWRTTLYFRAAPVWFGRFTGPVSRAELHELGRALMRNHYALRTAVGGRVRPDEKQRVLVAYLRHPVIRE